jgi:hypothetical protein
MTRLFKNFLKDPQEYDSAEEFWSNNWNDLIKHLGQERIWRSPWVNARFADGSRIRDANPIFSAVCPSHRRGVRIVQAESSAHPSETLRIDTFAKGESEEIRVLTVVCVLSDNTIRDVLDALARWITTGEVCEQISAKYE